MILRKELDREVEKVSTLVKNNPSLLEQLDYIDITNPMEDLQKKYDQISGKLTESEKELLVLR